MQHSIEAFGLTNTSQGYSGGLASFIDAMRMIQGKDVAMDKEAVDHQIVEMPKQYQGNGEFVDHLTPVELQGKQVDCLVPYPTDRMIAEKGAKVAA